MNNKDFSQKNQAMQNLVELLRTKYLVQARIYSGLGEQLDELEKAIYEHALNDFWNDKRAGKINDQNEWVGEEERN